MHAGIRAFFFNALPKPFIFIARCAQFGSALKKKALIPAINVMNGLANRLNISGWRQEDGSCYERFPYGEAASLSWAMKRGALRGPGLNANVIIVRSAAPPFLGEPSVAGHAKSRWPIDWTALCDAIWMKENQ